jgi:hypothetical protein
MFNLTPKPKPDEALMTFPQAMEEVIKGHKVTRKEWNDVQEFGLFADGWLTIHHEGKFFVWKVNDGDLFSNDWKVC